eukprot:7391450-Prymnesium_polylepis.2
MLLGAEKATFEAETLNVRPTPPRDSASGDATRWAQVPLVNACELRCSVVSGDRMRMKGCEAHYFSRASGGICAFLDS